MHGPGSRIGAAIDGERDRMVARLAVVDVATENPPGRAYPACVDVIERVLGQLRIEHERVEIASPSDAPQTAIAASVGDPGPTLSFHGHY